MQHAKNNSDNNAKNNSDHNAASLYSSPIFTLIVGEDRRLFTVHKAVLEKSYFFASCMQFKEGQTLEIPLPEDKPEHVEKIIAWLYTGQLEYHRPRISSDDARPALEDLVSLYIVADKYFVQGLRSRITEVFQNHFNLQGIGTAYSHHSFFRLLRAANLTDPDFCPLAKVLLDKLATDLRRYGWDPYISQVDPSLAEELMEDPSMMLRLVQRLAGSSVSLDHSLRSQRNLKRQRTATTMEEENIVFYTSG